MPSPERPIDAEAEQEPQPYYQAARFQSERFAGRTYRQAQAAIYNAREDVDLSAYRFHLNQIWHVAVLGEQPSAEFEQRIQQILAAGELTPLPEEVLKLLVERRAQATQLGPWVEGHYYPGKRYTLLNSEEDEDGVP